MDDIQCHKLLLTQLNQCIPDGQGGHRDCKSIAPEEFSHAANPVILSLFVSIMIFITFSFTQYVDKHRFALLPSLCDWLAGGCELKFIVTDELFG